MSPTSAVVGAL